MTDLEYNAKHSGNIVIQCRAGENILPNRFVLLCSDGRIRQPQTISDLPPHIQTRAILGVAVGKASAGGMVSICVSGVVPMLMLSPIPAAAAVDYGNYGAGVPYIPTPPDPEADPEIRALCLTLEAGSAVVLSDVLIAPGGGIGGSIPVPDFLIFDLARQLSQFTIPNHPYGLYVGLVDGEIVQYPYLGMMLPDHCYVPRVDQRVQKVSQALPASTDFYFYGQGAHVDNPENFQINSKISIGWHIPVDPTITGRTSVPPVYSARANIARDTKTAYIDPSGEWKVLEPPEAGTGESFYYYCYEPLRVATQYPSINPGGPYWGDPFPALTYDFGMLALAAPVTDQGLLYQSGVQMSGEFTLFSSYRINQQAVQDFLQRLRDANPVVVTSSHHLDATTVDHGMALGNNAVPLYPEYTRCEADGTHWVHLEKSRILNRNQRFDLSSPSAWDCIRIQRYTQTSDPVTNLTKVIFAGEVTSWNDGQYKGVMIFTFICLGSDIGGLFGTFLLDMTVGSNYILEEYKIADLVYPGSQDEILASDYLAVVLR